MPTTARFIVLWGAPQDPGAFNRHYEEVHIPLARKLPGLRRYTPSRNAVAVPGGEPWYLVAELDWDDISSPREAFDSPVGQATAEDVADLAKHAAVQSMIYELEDRLSTSSL
jgi:uncharacterized protein (TIGR02118 family)